MKRNLDTAIFLVTVALLWNGCDDPGLMEEADETQGDMFLMPESGQDLQAFDLAIEPGEIHGQALPAGSCGQSGQKSTGDDIGTQGYCSAYCQYGTAELYCSGTCEIQDQNCESGQRGYVKCGTTTDWCDSCPSTCNPLECAQLCGGKGYGTCAGDQCVCY